MVIVNNYLGELEEKVARYADPRYCKMLYFNIGIKVNDTKINHFVVDVICLIIWPVLCIATLLKAEYEYDRIVRQSVWRKTEP